MLLPLGAAIMMWGYTWVVTKPPRIATMVSLARYSGTMGGVTYVFNKLTVITGIFLFAAVFLFQEVCGFQLD